MTRSKFYVPGALSLFAVLTPVLALATQPAPVGQVNASSAAQVMSRGAMSIGSNGSALSYAASSQSASARVTAVMSPSRSNASITGDTATRSGGVAYNTSSGSASGLAMSSGSVHTGVQGQLALAGGNVAGGSAGTDSSFLIAAGRGQGSAVQGSTSSGFETLAQRSGGVNAPACSTSVSVPGLAVQLSTTGYVSGSNASAALQGMSAADVARIDASGSFQGYGNVAVTVGASPVSSGSGRRGAGR